MRIIHTSDWHLGQHFMGKSREAEHRGFLAWLLETITSEKADALIVSGDIFDTGTPPSYARTLYNNFIVKLQQAGECRMVVMGGNHDSVSTLNETRELLACLNTTVLGGICKNPEEQVLVLKRSNGEPGALLCAIPFIRPRDVLESRAGESSEDKQHALAQAVSGHYDSVFQAAVLKRDKISNGTPLPIIATGHLTTVGGLTSESVRDIYIGTLDAFPAGKFPPADYIALGHLHRGQKIKNADHIRYSGSPIPLSFDEAGSEKQVLMVDFKEGKLDSVQSVPVPTFQKLHCIKGDLALIEKEISGLPDPEENKTLWLEVEVAGDSYLSDLQQRVQAMVEERPVEVLRIRRKRNGNRPDILRESKEKLQELSVHEVFDRRLAAEEHDEEIKKSLMASFNEIVAEIVDK